MHRPPTRTTARTTPRSVPRTACLQRTIRSHAGLDRSCVLAAASAAAMLMLIGCGSSGDERDVQIRTVGPTEFVALDGEPGTDLLMPTQMDRGDAATDAPDVLATRPASAGEISPGSRSFRVVPGEPLVLSDVGVPMEAPQLLDAKVGDVNGRPVFVSSFLGPIKGRLEAEAERMGREEWMRMAAGVIQSEMRSLITDELLRAEALSRLSVDQKAGLRRFLDDVRRNLLSQNRGSQQLAEDRLRREQGLSQEEFLRQREDRTLVRFTLQEEIQDRINVSWRDIVRRYARDGSKYNPAPTARYYILRVDADDEAARSSVEGDLAAGTPFADLASSDLNTWTLDEGGARDVELVGAIADVELFAVPELNDPARTLSEGGVVGPTPFGSSLVWIHLDSVNSESTSLYDAQLTISDQIRNERTATELERYIDRLLGRASMSDVESMMIRLLQISAERYGPEASGAAPRRPGG